MVLSFDYLGCRSAIWRTIGMECVIVHGVYEIDLSGGGFYHIPIERPLGWQPSRTPMLDDAPTEPIIG